MRHSFGKSPDFTVGIEEELLLVDPDSHLLSHTSDAVLARLGLDSRSARHDIYQAQLELSSPVCRDADEAAQAIRGLREAVRDADATVIGAGIHPAGEFGDVRLVEAERYARESEYLQGLVRRTPDCALHIHVGMPDPQTAIRVCNGLRELLPLLEALSANSPFWHGLDSGLASARRALRRGFPRVDIPPPFRDFEEYEAVLERVIAAGELKDSTFVWWEVRLQPRFGTVEVRAMDSQSSLPQIAGLTALVQGICKHLAECEPGRSQPPEVIAESSFRASRYGLRARLWDQGSLRPVIEIARDAIELARPHARELGSEAPLEEIEQFLREGNGAERQRAAYERNGMRAVLELLVGEMDAGYPRR